MTPLRILHVVESLAREAGSAVISVAGLSKSLNAHGMMSTVISVDGNSDEPAGHAAAKPNGKAAPCSADVVHVHGWHPAHAGKISRWLGEAKHGYVLSPLGGLTEGPYQRRKFLEKLRFAFKERALIKKAGLLAAFNELEKASFESRKLNKRVEILPYGLCMEEYESEVKPRITALPRPEDKVLLVLGPIHPAEGLVFLLKAFAEIGPAADGWAIAMAGPEVGHWGRMLEAAVRRKGGAGRARFVSAADVTAQREWLARASLLIAPSLHLRCPVSIMQAAAAGVPVIASECAAPSDTDGAILICPPSREALTQKLRSVLEQTDAQRREMGRRARNAGRTLFDWSKLVERYTARYREIAQRD